MTKSCPIPTPEQRQYMEIREAAERAMLDKVYKAIDDATAEVADKVQKAGLEYEPTSNDYFTFATQQVLFVRLCGGDPNTLEGGDPEIGAKIVSNRQHIIDHDWKK
jgi:sugar phosphate isomerase/epimerase